MFTIKVRDGLPPDLQALRGWVGSAGREPAATGSSLSLGGAGPKQFPVGGDGLLRSQEASSA